MLGQNNENWKRQTNHIHRTDHHNRYFHISLFGQSTVCRKQIRAMCIINRSSANEKNKMKNAPNCVVLDCNFSKGSVTRAEIRLISSFSDPIRDVMTSKTDSSDSMPVVWASKSSWRVEICWCSSELSIWIEFPNWAKTSATTLLWVFLGFEAGTI